MTECEICGKQATKKAKIDGIVLDVCDECAKLGEVISSRVSLKPKRKVQEIPESSLYIDSDFPKIISNAREKLGLTREEVAKKLNERESVISKIERGELLPTLDFARKLEIFFKVKLILEYEDNYKNKSSKEESLTIGDVIKIKEKQHD